MLWTLPAREGGSPEIVDYGLARRIGSGTILKEPDTGELVVRRRVERMPVPTEEKRHP